MRLEIIDAIRLLIVAFLSYMPTVAFAGWFEAWIAKKVGDDIPEQAGFLTLNPLAHFSTFGFGALLVGIFFGHYMPIFRGIPGWGKHVPITPSVLMGRHRSLRTVLALTARSLGHFIATVFAFAVMVLFLHVSKIHTGTPLVFSQGTSLIEALRFVLYFFFQQNSVLFIIYFIIGVFHSIVYFYFPQLHLFSTQTMLWTIAILLLAIFIGSPLLEMFLYKFFMLVESLLVGA